MKLTNLEKDFGQFAIENAQMDYLKGGGVATADGPRYIVPDGKP